MLTPKTNFFNLPERNKYYCHQDNKIHGYRILDHDKKDLYQVNSKTVATRSHFRVVRMKDSVAVGSIDQGQLASTYTIKDEVDTLLATIKIPDADEIKLEIQGGNSYEGKPVIRGRQFEFYDMDERLVLTIDKKLITFSDKYQVSFIEDFPAKVAAFLPVIVDDYYHKGTTM